MVTVGDRLRVLRTGVGVSQKKVAEMLEIGQPSITRYENGTTEAPHRVLLWYADYFDVSMDYIFGRTDKPQGKLYNYEPQALRERAAKQEDWREFVEACFDPDSPMSAKLKETLMQMGRDEK